MMRGLDLIGAVTEDSGGIKPVWIFLPLGMLALGAAWLAFGGTSTHATIRASRGASR